MDKVVKRDLEKLGVGTGGKVGRAPSESCHKRKRKGHEKKRNASQADGYTGSVSIYEATLLQVEYLVKDGTPSLVRFEGEERILKPYCPPKKEEGRQSEENSKFHAFDSGLKGKLWAGQGWVKEGVLGGRRKGGGRDPFSLRVTSNQCLRWCPCPSQGVSCPGKVAWVP
ncbi:hypothetical protein IE53DRAFT_244489 [Violaceomyces palustris]|uniref:Uncharacterized protein n=1 Tax=Violaceomyces palustris TaxID=1673888 RepID=A0ACD0NP36_9BASI|nr:hypothetical protein IE53DRAFT_244489 [Violaceomyces palustris]